MHSGSDDPKQLGISDVISPPRKCDKSLLEDLNEEAKGNPLPGDNKGYVKNIPFNDFIDRYLYFVNSIEGRPLSSAPGY